MATEVRNECKYVVAIAGGYESTVGKKVSPSVGGKGTGWFLIRNPARGKATKKKLKCQRLERLRVGTKE